MGDVWLAMILCGLVTFGLRFVFLSRLVRIQLSPGIRDALSYVPIAVLTAIIVPEILSAPSSDGLSAMSARLPAALLAIVVALITRSVLMTLSIGLIGLWIIEYLFYSGI